VHDSYRRVRPVIAPGNCGTREPFKGEVGTKVAKPLSADPNAHYGPPKVVRSGQSEFYPEIPDFLLVVAAHDAEHLQLLRQVRLKSAICVPIKARANAWHNHHRFRAGRLYSDRSGTGGRYRSPCCVGG